MKIQKLLLIIVPAIALSGCATNYRYEARGELPGTDGEPRNAVLYWFKDEGRLWYGSRYEQVDSDAILRVCNDLPRPFSPDDDGWLALEGKSGDLLAARILPEGGIEPLAEPLQELAACGRVQVNGQPAGTVNMAVGIQPVVSILCRNPARPGRYPEIGSYRFSMVSRVVTDDKRTGAEPCE